MFQLPRYKAFSRPSGLTLIELLLVVAMIGVLVGIALPAYQGYQERAKQAQAIQDIRALGIQIREYQQNHGNYPHALAEIGKAARTDPWGRAYVYLELSSPANKGRARKDRKLFPINSDFDLYSLGKDGLSRVQLTSRESLDDIVRANDGAFVGLAANYSQ